jgi:phospholipase/lecithinase/hemolysin
MIFQARKVILACILSVFLIISTAAGAYSYSSILAFGDSLSDNGKYGQYPAANSYTNPADVFGFQRYSNGPVWVEYLAQNYGISLLDMAYGGATSGWNDPAAYSALGAPYDTTTGLQWQVTAIASISSDTLITVWAGGNDMLNYSSNPVLYDPVVAAHNVAIAIQNLINKGGKNFIVPNLSYNAITDPTTLAGAVAWMTPFDYYLALYLQGLDAIPGINIYEIDLTQLYYEGLNLNGTFKTPGNEVGPFANWDSVHPTTEAHQQIALYVENQVPEPASIILLLIGIAGLVSVRKRMRMK